jgi:hypothetical protein
MQARSLAFTSLVFAAFGSMSGAAYADVTGAPSRNLNNAGNSGPTVQNQEVTAFTPRTPDPYFQPKGIPLEGPFRFYPSLLVGVSYDDNVFRTPVATSDDYFFTIAPSLDLNYNTSRATVDLFANAGFYEYSRFTTLSNSNYNTGLQGLYQISGAAYISGGAGWALLSEPISSPNTAGFQNEPTQYQDFNAHGEWSYKPNRLGVTIGGTYDAYSFNSATRFPILNPAPPPATLPLPPLFNFDRNNQVAAGYVTVSYDFSPGYSAFITGSYNNDNYTRPDFRTDPVNGILRSSHGFKVDGGVSVLLGDLMQGKVYLGYINQDYNQAHFFLIPGTAGPQRLHNVDGLDFGADLYWYPTELLTVHLGAARNLTNTTLAGASAGDDRGVNLGLQYELTRRIQLLGSFSYDDTFYNGTARPLAFPTPLPNRDDQTWSFDVGGKWLISHYVNATLDYRYTDRSSNTPNVQYTDNTVMLGLNLQI